MINFCPTKFALCAKHDRRNQFWVTEVLARKKKLMFFPPLAQMGQNEANRDETVDISSTNSNQLFRFAKKGNDIGI